MLQLPALPSSNAHRQLETTGFKGLDLTENTADGELRDSLGLTSDKFPTLSTMKGQSTNKQFPSGEGLLPVSDIFAWDKLAVICDGKFYYDDMVRGDISDGLKQFAVVNTKLCIFPDKVYLDLTDPTKRLQPLQASLTARAGSATFSGKKLTISGTPSGTAHAPVTITMTHDELKWICVYDSLTWSSGAWTKGVMTEKLIKDLAGGDLTIPDADGALITTTVQGDYTGANAENTAGKAAKITSATATSTAYRWEKWSTSSYPVQYYSPGQTQFSSTDPDADPYESYTGYSFNSSTGQYAVSGSRVTVIPADGASATTYDSAGSALLTYRCTGKRLDIYVSEAEGPYWGSEIGKGSTQYDDVYAASSSAYPSNGEQGGYWYVAKGASDLDKSVVFGYDLLDITSVNARFSVDFKVGDRVRISGCETYTDNNTPENEVITISAVSDYELTFDISENFDAGTDAGSVKVEKPVPDLDYICESDNRLWGVCNATRTIYASALGDPTDFWSLGLLSTDAWQAAVGTDGDWTGIYKAGGGVCCFKEHALHKVLGSYPAQYQVNTYSVPGVQAGSARSLQVINETLYYKGVDGVYAYGGGTPTLISPGFSGVQFDYAVAGSDSGHYYITMLRRDTESYGMYVLDLSTGIWLKTDDTKAAAYATLNNVVYAAIGRAVLALGGAGNSDGVEWLAEFVPFMDMTANRTAYTFNRKKYKRLLLRLDMDAGSELYIETKSDREDWKRVYAKRAGHEVTVRVPLQLGRCDRFALKIYGTGGVTIYALQRELIYGSEV